jgi:pimeloyl-ACP methyl ester carboxylesterase
MAVLVWVVLAPVLLAACGGSSGGSGQASGTPQADAAGTVWLCQPGVTPDPCLRNLDVTSVPASGSRTVEDVSAAANSKFDCFYIYPTVSTQATKNSTLAVQPAETDAAIDQASPFSQVCRVWAPMYRQRTLVSLLKGLGGDPSADLVAYRSVLAGWTDYLAHFNDGRPVIFIGHSQGAAMLIRLLAARIDPSSSLRRQMVAAILLGGNVAVPVGKQVGATFKHLALCTSSTEVGCVIAFSSFPSEPPIDSLFGRPGQGVSLQSGQTRRAGVKVACVNPAAIGGATHTLDPVFRTSTMPPLPPAVATKWVTFPDLYTSTCRYAGGASWLQVTDIAAAGDLRPVVTETIGAEWGYHGYDVNLALGDLVNDVRGEERAYELGSRG